MWHFFTIRICLFEWFRKSKRNNETQRILNIKISYKQDNLVDFLKHDYKYDIHRNTKIIPNDINGKVVLEERTCDTFIDVI